MQKFYHKELKDLTTLLQALNAVADSYNKKEVTVFAALQQWLTDAIQFYNGAGKAERESRLQLLKAEMITAQRNINPITLEKVTLHRQEMQATIAFKILQAAEQSLRTEVVALEERIETASELTTQVVIAGLQAGIITDAIIKNETTQKALESLWAALSANENIALGQMRILLTVSIYDVWILLDEVVARLKN
ncbi:MAG: hypothetical protein ABIN57_09395 [Chitinophagaceae bacterium]